MLAQLECPRGQTQALHRQGVWRQRLECPRGQTQALHRQRLVLVLLALVLYRHRLVLVLLAVPPTPAARPAAARPAAAAAARVEALPTGRRTSGPGPCPKPCGPALWMRTLEGLSRVVDADASGLASWVLYRQRLVHCC